MTKSAKDILDKENAGLREFQAFHQWLDQEKNFDTDMFVNIAFLAEEVGEVVRAIRHFKKAAGLPNLEAARGQVGEELADCLAYILKLANYSDVDLQTAYVDKMKQNTMRTWKHRSNHIEP